MALLQITPFLLQRRPTFSAGPSPATVWGTAADKLWEGHGKLQSITISFWPVILMRLQTHKGEKSHPELLRNVPFGKFFPHTAWTSMLSSLLWEYLCMSSGKEAAEHLCPPLADNSSATAVRPLLVRQAPDCYICLQIPLPVFFFLKPQAAPFDV